MVERFSPFCSNDLFAFVELKIIDSHHRNVLKAGCAADIFPTKERVRSIASQVGISDHWVELKQNDVYGELGSFAMQAGKGTYSVRAEFIPARLGQANFEALAARKIVVLQQRITATPVTVRVR